MITKYYQKQNKKRFEGEVRRVKDIKIFLKKKKTKNKKRLTKGNKMF